MNSIEINDLTTGYTTRKGFIEIEKRLTATLSAGELTCLLGPNGAGKSTLLRTLSGFQIPLKGTINIDGKELRQYSQRELSQKIGVVLTEKPDVTSMTVEQLVALGRSPYTGFWGRLTNKDEKVVIRSMELAHVYHMRERLVSTLSDGERQKAMIAKALAQETPIIFLDEPTAFLDFQSKVEMMLLLKRLAREEKKSYSNPLMMSIWRSSSPTRFGWWTRILARPSAHLRSLPRTVSYKNISTVQESVSMKIPDYSILCKVSFTTLGWARPYSIESRNSTIRAVTSARTSFWFSLEFI